MARPSKLNDDIIKNIADEVADGLPIQYSCDLYGIHGQSYLNWLNQGAVDYDNEVDSLERKFFDAIKKAYAKFIRESKKTIRAGANGWQGMAWWLERTNKDFQMSAAEVNVPENITINTRMTKKGNKDEVSNS